MPRSKKAHHLNEKSEAVSAPHWHDEQPAPCGHARRTRTVNRSFLLELAGDNSPEAERMKENMKTAAIT